MEKKSHVNMKTQMNNTKNYQMDLEVNYCQQWELESDVTSS